jgi:cytochrome b
MPYSSPSPDPDPHFGHGRDRVWDLPVRLFHWLTVALFGFCWWSADNDHMDWHMLSGYAVLTLVLFRIYWGFAGSATARFAGFLRGPRDVLGYARNLLHRSESVTFGHNPMGGWSVSALILLLLLQTVLGLFAIDVDGIYGGPLDTVVSFETGREVAHLHSSVFNLLLMLSGLHVAAVLFYLLVKRENLIGPMVTGRRRLPPGAPRPELRFAPLWLAIPGLLAAGLLVAWVALGRF